MGEWPQWNYWFLGIFWEWVTFTRCFLHENRFTEPVLPWQRGFKRNLCRCFVRFGGCNKKKWHNLKLRINLKISCGVCECDFQTDNLSRASELQCRGVTFSEFYDVIMKTANKRVNSVCFTCAFLNDLFRLFEWFISPFLTRWYISRYL